MKHIFKLILLNTLLFIGLYVCSIAVLKVLSLFGTTYDNTHSVAFAATLLAMVVLHLYNYQKIKREKKQLKQS